MTEDEPVEYNCVRACTLVTEGGRKEITLLRLADCKERVKTKSEDRNAVMTGLRHNMRVSDIQLLTRHADALKRER